MQPIIDIWQARLDISPQLEKEYWAVLNAEEQHRASRFVRREHQTRFVAGRGILRSLLGDYLNVAPDDIELDYLSHGKPILGKKHGCCNLQFNVSHSQDLALYAIAISHQSIGIDVEFIRPFPQALSLARRFFTAQEVADLVSFPRNEQEREFFRVWTAKEAYLKATGEGLSGLDNIELATNQNSQQFAVRRSEVKVHLYSFTPAHHFVASVATVETDCLTPKQASDQVLDICHESLKNQLVFRDWEA